MGRFGLRAGFRSPQFLVSDDTVTEANTPRSSRRVIEFQGERREYWLHVPPNLDASSPIPLVLLLHGAGGTGRWAMDETRIREHADRWGWFVVAPNGTPPARDEPASFLHNPRLWNDGSRRGMIANLGTDDVAFLDHLLATLTAQLPVDPRRVFATGFSNGASMVFRLAAEGATRLAAIAPVASHAWVVGPPAPRPMPTLFIIGDADPLVPLAGGQVRTPWSSQSAPKPPIREMLDRWAVAQGHVPLPALVSRAGGVRVERYGAGDSGAEFRVMIVEGLGHHWPGGLARLNPRIAGAASERLDATREIGEFFARRPLPLA